MLAVNYLGHSCFMLSDGSHTLIIDPFLSGNSLAETSPADVTCDYILVSHGHGDHWGDSEEIAKNNDAVVIGPNEIAVYASRRGLRMHKMHIGGGHDFPFGRIKLTIAHHGFSDGESGFDIGGSPCGFVIEIDGRKIYHAGDTGLFMDMQLIGEEGLDLAFLPIGDNFTMGIDDAVRAVDFLKPKLTVPMHYNTFELIKADPQEFCSKLKNKDYDCRVMNIGDRLEL
ncbi:MAG: metal-dependent hydrolase [candidate division Zixibacteria bacterium]|nr:metal-dependent hydrolase [candidate division Zixibacteria bacterium]